MSTAKLNAVGHRWLGQLADFHFEIRYKPGILNTDADTLSCWPLDIEAYMDQCSQMLPEEAVHATWEETRAAQQRDVAWVAALGIASQQHAHTEPFPTISHDELADEQWKDPAIEKILELKRANIELTEAMRQTLDGPAKKLSREWCKLHVEDGLLYRKTLARKQLVLPTTYRQTAFTYLHDKMGHVGVERVLSLARERFYWLFMKKDIEEYVTRKCHCIKWKKPATQDRAPMGE